MPIVSGPSQARTPFTGTRLRLARVRRRLRQEQVAELLGVGRAAVSHYELGRRRPTGEVLDRALDFIEDDRGASS